MKATTWLALCAATILTLTAVNGRAGILSADLNIDKTVVSPTATPGAQITYSIVAENAGPNDAASTTTVADTFAASLGNCTWTCTASAGSSCTAAGVGNISDTVSLLVNGTATYSATCDIDPAATGNLDNTATITADASLTDPNLADNESTVSSTLVPSADLSISKTDNQASHTPGTPVSYTIVAANNGPSDVGDALVGDTFAAPLSNCSWTSVAAGGATGNTNASGNLSDTLGMPAGSSVTYTATCDVDPAAFGDLSNTATIGSVSVADPAGGNDSATDISALGASADLAISKTDNQASHTPGTPVSYTIVADNNGPSAVGDALVSDTFAAPLSNCSWTSVAAGGATGNTNASGNLSDTLSMPAGSSVTYTATCDVDPAATGDLSNTATIGSVSVADPAGGNDSATDISALGASADLSISKTDGETQHLAGTPISYTIVAQNSGPSAVSDAIVSDAFPAPLQNCSWTSTAAGGATGNTDGSGTLNDTLSMPVGSSVTYTAICGIPADATGTLSNTATISSASATDPAPGNESATDGNTVLGAPVAVPTLSIWSLLALFAALALFGGAAVSRRLA